MGWDFGMGDTKKSVIADRIAPTSRTKTLTHAVRGNVLWTVRETTHPNGNVERWIGCDLLGSKKGFGWGYKDMSESEGPCYYTCPVTFLEMTPVANNEWRSEVWKYHRRTKQKLEVGQVVKLVNASIPEVKIVSTRPLRGTYDGVTYRVPRRMLAYPTPA